MKIETIISRKSVMGIVEGISVTISQHNGGTPSFEQLWASDSESPKLDIYYREAIGDLERILQKWLVSSTGQFDLQASADDYTLRLDVAQSWPKRLKGLLDNKVQDYLVHSVTTGWLNDFDGLTIKQDYQAMAEQDIKDIVYIVGLKSFGFAEAERTADTDNIGQDTSASVGERRNDIAKDDNDSAVTAGDRHDKLDAALNDGDAGIEAQARHDDDSEVRIHHDYTDWSGTMPFGKFSDMRHKHCGHIHERRQ